MLVFLDANVVVYLIEQPPDWGARAAARIKRLQAAGDELAVSDLVRMECRVGPLLSGDTTTLDAFDRFFASSHVRVLPITGAVCDRAAEIRAAHRFNPMDALHLAAAVEHRCDTLLTHDARLREFQGMSIEVLS